MACYWWDSNASTATGSKKAPRIHRIRGAKYKSAPKINNTAILAKDNTEKFGTYYAL